MPSGASHRSPSAAQPASSSEAKGPRIYRHHGPAPPWLRIDRRRLVAPRHADRRRLAFASSGRTPGAASGRSSSPIDQELNREVALKEIQSSHADDPDSRRVSCREAEITGGLEHPGIVPVYGLGQYGDGRPYYAMRFIRGDSLKEPIEQVPPGGASRPRSGRVDRWRPEAARAVSSTSATPSTTPTVAASCTATLSRPTSCSANTARRWSSIGGRPS